MSHDQASRTCSSREGEWQGVQGEEVDVGMQCLQKGREQMLAQDDRTEDLNVQAAKKAYHSEECMKTFTCN